MADFSNAFLRILGNNAKRNQQAQMTQVNADTMRYSPWTKLADNAYSGQQSNMQFNPAFDLAQNTAKTLGFDKLGDKETDSTTTKQTDALNNFNLDSSTESSLDPSKIKMLLAMFQSAGGAGV